MLLLRNAHKTERGAKQFLTLTIVRAASFALLKKPTQRGVRPRFPFGWITLTKKHGFGSMAQNTAKLAGSVPHLSPSA